MADRRMFHERIRQTLQTVADEWLDAAVGQLNQRLREAMTRIAPRGTRLDTDTLRFTRLGFDFNDTGLLLSGTARGSIGIEFESP